MMMVSAIILAAGTSRRMGEQNKLLLPFGNGTIITHLTSQIIASNVTEIIFVTGHEAKKVQAAIPFSEKLRIVHNPDFHKGMGTSIRAGVAAASKKSVGFMICLADMPLISSNDYTKLISALVAAVANQFVLSESHGPHPLNPPLLEGEGELLPPSPSRRGGGGEVRSKQPDIYPQIIIPTYRGQQGNPVIFSRHFREEILAANHSGGCKPLIKEHHSKVMEVEMASDAILRDIDTNVDYQELHL